MRQSKQFSYNPAWESKTSYCLDRAWGPNLASVVSHLSNALVVVGLKTIFMLWKSENDHLQLNPEFNSAIEQQVGVTIAATWISLLLSV